MLTSLKNMLILSFVAFVAGSACKNPSGPRTFEATKQLQEACDALKAWSPEKPSITLVEGDGTVYEFAASGITQKSAGGTSQPVTNSLIATARCVLHVQNGSLSVYAVAGHDNK